MNTREIPMFDLRVSQKEGSILLDAMLEFRRRKLIEPRWQFLGDGLMRKLVLIGAHKDSCLTIPREEIEREEKLWQEAMADREPAETGSTGLPPRPLYEPATAPGEDKADTDMWHDPADYVVFLRDGSGDPWQHSHVGSAITRWQEAHERTKGIGEQKVKVTRNGIRVRFSGRGALVRAYTRINGVVRFVK